MKPFQAQTFYELLEISVSASAADVQAAFQRLIQLYADDQVVLYGLIDPGSAEALRARLREAADVLGDDARRDAYDVSLGLPSRNPKPSAPVPAAEVVRPTAPPKPAEVARTSSGWASSYTFVTSAPPSTAPAAVSTWSIPLPPPLSRAIRAEMARAAPPPPVVVEPPPAPPVAPVIDAALEAERAEAERRAQEAQQAAAEALARAEQERRELEAREAVEREVRQRAAEAEEQRLREAARLERERREAEAAELERKEAERVAAARREAEAPPPAVAAPPEPGRLGDDVQVSLAVRTPVRPVDAKPPPYEVPTGVEFNGDLLKQVRMARGLSLLQLAERTRIGVRHLENIEGDRYPSLPATVYLRGMLMNLARELGLDGLRVAKSYLSFVDAHGAKPKD